MNAELVSCVLLCGKTFFDGKAGEKGKLPRESFVEFFRSPQSPDDLIVLIVVSSSIHS